MFIASAVKNITSLRVGYFHRQRMGRSLGLKLKKIFLHHAIANYWSPSEALSSSSINMAGSSARCLKLSGVNLDAFGSSVSEASESSDGSKNLPWSSGSGMPCILGSSVGGFF